MPATEPVDRSDVLVIGAGTAGLSAAHHLSSRGLRVTVLEARHPFGPTLFKEIGLCLVGFMDTENRVEHGLGAEATREVTRFSIEAVRGVVDAASSLGCTALQGAIARQPFNRTEAEDLARSAPILRECGATVTEERDGAVRIDEDALVDVRAFHAGLSRTLANVHPTVPVTSLHVDADGAVAETKGGEFRGEIAIVANGPRLVDLRPDLLGAVFPLRGQGARFPEALAPGRPRGITMQYGHENYVVEKSGALVAFGFNPSAKGGDVGLSEEPTEEFQRFLAGYARTRFPEIRGRKPTQTWGAPLAFTRDGLPLVGPVPGLPRVLVAAGFCGRGLPLGFEAGRRLAALVAGEKPEIPRAFSLRRAAVSPREG